MKAHARVEPVAQFYRASHTDNTGRPAYLRKEGVCRAVLCHQHLIGTTTPVRQFYRAPATDAPWTGLHHFVWETALYRGTRSYI